MVWVPFLVHFPWHNQGLEMVVFQEHPIKRLEDGRFVHVLVSILEILVVKGDAFIHFTNDAGVIMGSGVIMGLYQVYHSGRLCFGKARVEIRVAIIAFYPVQFNNLLGPPDYFVEPRRKGAYGNVESLPIGSYDPFILRQEKAYDFRVLRIYCSRNPADCLKVRKVIGDFDSLFCFYLVHGVPFLEC